MGRGLTHSHLKINESVVGGVCTSGGKESCLTGPCGSSQGINHNPEMKHLFAAFRGFIPGYPSAHVFYAVGWLGRILLGVDSQVVCMKSGCLLVRCSSNLLS